MYLSNRLAFLLVTLQIDFDTLEWNAFYQKPGSLSIERLTMKGVGKLSSRILIVVSRQA